MTTPGIPIIPGSLSSTVTPGESVRPVHTGQKAQLEKADQCLAQSELPVLNSPVTSVQLELNVHEPLGNMPTLQIEHLSEHSHVFQDFTISDSPDVRADDSTVQTHLQDSGHRSSGIGHTVNPLSTGHTDNRSDCEHSVHRSGLVRSDAIEHGSDRTRHRSDVSRSSRRNSITHRVSIPLRHTDPDDSLQLRLSDIVALEAVLALTTLSLRDVIVVPPLVREGRRSHIRGGSTLPLLVPLLTALPLLPLENEKESGTSLRRRNTLNHVRPIVTSVRKSTREGSPSPSPSSSSSSVSSDSSSSLQRSPARKKSRVNSRSPSPADDNPHSASRTVCPASHGIISVYLRIMMTSLIRILRIIRI